MVFLVQFGVAQKAEIEAARAILAFWQQHWLYNTEKAFVAFEKTHLCKLIPNWTRNRKITHT